MSGDLYSAGGTNYEPLIPPAELVTAILAGESPLGEDWRRPAGEMDEMERLLRLARVNALLPTDNAIEQHTTHDATLENYIRLALNAAGDRQTLGTFLDCVQYVMDTYPDDAAFLAQQVLWIWAPAADIAGFYKAPLEDTAFSVLMPDEYGQLRAEYNRAAFEEPDSPLARIRHQLEIMLNGCLTEDSSVHVTARSKGMFSVWEKSQRKKRALADIFDLAGLRIIIDNPDEAQAVIDCYHAKALLSEFDMDLDRYKDYIQAPKPNGYQSIHLALTSAAGMSFELQIRTRRMHEEAEGDVVISHRANAATFRSTPGKILRTHRKPSRLYAWRDQAANSIEAHDGHIKEIMGEEILFFRPDGNLYRLPATVIQNAGEYDERRVETTILDACFRIHSAKALRVRQVHINGAIAQLSDPVRHGDVLHVDYWPTALSREIRFDNLRENVRTSYALRAIRQGERQAVPAEVWRERGIEVVEALLGGMEHIGICEVLSRHDKEWLAAQAGLPSFDRRLEIIGQGELSGKPGRIANLVRKRLGLPEVAAPHPEAAPPAIPPQNVLEAIIVPSLGGDVKWRIADCCVSHIQYGDEILARGGRDDGVFKVHRTRCANVRTYIGTIPCQWHTELA